MAAADHAGAAPAGGQSAANLLAVNDLRVTAPGRNAAADVELVRGIDLTVAAGEVVAIVGESGSGKSLTCLSLLRLVPPGCHVAAQRMDIVTGDGKTQAILELDADGLRRLRGGTIAAIFQEPMSALNPVATIGAQISETLLLHGARHGVDRRQRRRRAVELLGQVGISEPERRFGQYPHELSGGMRQRVMIAMALSCEPRLLLADEPTTSLDTTVQAQILALLRDLSRRLGVAIVFVTHDLGVVAQIADRVNVLYAGEVVECGPVDQVLLEPAHPYTRALLAALPSARRDGRFTVIDGAAPQPERRPAGCAFHPRCDLALAGTCDAGPIALRAVGRQRATRCWRTAPLPPGQSR